MRARPAKPPGEPRKSQAEPPHHSALIEVPGKHKSWTKAQSLAGSPERAHATCRQPPPAQVAPPDGQSELFTSCGKTGCMVQCLVAHKKRSHLQSCVHDCHATPRRCAAACCPCVCSELHNRRTAHPTGRQVQDTRMLAGNTSYGREEASLKNSSSSVGPSSSPKPGQRTDSPGRWRSSFSRHMTKSGQSYSSGSLRGASTERLRSGGWRATHSMKAATSGDRQ